MASNTTPQEKETVLNVFERERPIRLKRGAIMFRVWKRGVIFGAIALAGCVSILLWKSAGPRAPVYDGRSISELLEESVDLPQARIQLHHAVGHLKGEAVPYLVHVIMNEPTPLQTAYERLFFCIPKGWRQRFPAPRFSENRRGTCAALLGSTGSDGVAQIPFLARLSMEDPGLSVRLNAINALRRLGPGSEYESVALEALITATRESDARIAERGYGGMGAFTNRPVEVVPVLLKGLENPTVREVCIHSLKRLGAAAEPLIQAAIARGEVSILQLDVGSPTGVKAKSDDALKLTELF